MVETYRDEAYYKALELLAHGRLLAHAVDVEFYNDLPEEKWLVERGGRYYIITKRWLVRGDVYEYRVFECESLDTATWLLWDFVSEVEGWVVDRLDGSLMNNKYIRWLVELGYYRPARGTEPDWASVHA